MTVDTKNVAERREISYQTYDDLLTDVESLSSQDVKMLGNWSFAQIIEHLGIALEGSIDGIPIRAPWPLRTFAKLFLKKKLLTGSLQPGFQIPESAKPVVYPDENTTTDEALNHLRRAVQRCKNESKRGSHPLFDTITREEWDLWNLRHAEMHMSFVIPDS